MSDDARRREELVEDGVVPLVSELGRIAEVVVLDSRQGGREWPSYVLMRERDGHGLRLADAIAQALASHGVHLDCELRTMWRPGCQPGDAIIELTCPAAQVMAVAQALRATQRPRHQRRARRAARPRSQDGAPPRLRLV